MQVDRILNKFHQHPSIDVFHLFFHPPTWKQNVFLCVGERGDGWNADNKNHCIVFSSQFFKETEKVKKHIKNTV